LEKKSLLNKFNSLRIGNKVPVYIYDAITKNLVNNKPFTSLSDAAIYLNVEYRKISRHLNTNKAIKGGPSIRESLVYLFDKKLEVVPSDYIYMNKNKAKAAVTALVGREEERKNSPLSRQRERDYNLVIARTRNYNTRLWVYLADTLELVNSGPFETILSAAQYLNTDRSTIHRKLDSNKPAMLRKKSLSVYFFSQELDSQLKGELNKQLSTKYVRSVIWVYKVLDNGEFILLPNQPFKSKREAGRELGMDPKYITKYLNTNEGYRNFIFLSLPKQL
jgi:hypothetical protein